MTRLSSLGRLLTYPISLIWLGSFSQRTNSLVFSAVFLVHFLVPTIQNMMTKPMIMAIIFIFLLCVEVAPLLVIKTACVMEKSSLKKHRNKWPQYMAVLVSIGKPYSALPHRGKAKCINGNDNQLFARYCTLLVMV
jgi:hypothetical protein